MQTAGELGNSLLAANRCKYDPASIKINKYDPASIKIKQKAARTGVRRYTAQKDKEQ